MSEEERTKTKGPPHVVEPPEFSPMATARPVPVSTEAPSPSPESHTWWFIELWLESRDIFKEFIKHTAIFGLFYVALLGFHALQFRSSLPQNQKDVLDAVHFYMTVISLVIFSASFIIKALIFEYRGKIR